MQRQALNKAKRVLEKKGRKQAIMFCLKKTKSNTPELRDALFELAEFDDPTIIFNYLYKHYGNYCTDTVNKHYNDYCTDKSKCSTATSMKINKYKQYKKSIAHARNQSQIESTPETNKTKHQHEPDCAFHMTLRKRESHTHKTQITPKRIPIPASLRGLSPRFVDRIRSKHSPRFQRSNDKDNAQQTIREEVLHLALMIRRIFVAERRRKIDVFRLVQLVLKQKHHQNRFILPKDILVQLHYLSDDIQSDFFTIRKACGSESVQVAVMKKSSYLDTLNEIREGMNVNESVASAKLMRLQCLPRHRQLILIIIGLYIHTAKQQYITYFNLGRVHNMVAKRYNFNPMSNSELILAVDGLISCAMVKCNSNKLIAESQLVMSIKFKDIATAFKDIPVYKQLIANLHIPRHYCNKHHF